MHATSKIDLFPSTYTPQRHRRDTLAVFKSIGSCSDGGGRQTLTAGEARQVAKIRISFAQPERASHT